MGLFQLMGLVILLGKVRKLLFLHRLRFIRNSGLQNKLRLPLDLYLSTSLH
jgi:hypothetical protein